MSSNLPFSPNKEPARTKHEKLYDVLYKKILVSASGSRLPSVRSLMKRYHLSLQTVNAALRRLELENLIVTRRGSGIYVSDQRKEKLIVLHRSLHPSHYEDSKENAFRSLIHREGWHMAVRRHEAVDEDDMFGEAEPKASAHIVSQDLANLKFDLLNRLLKQKVPVVLYDRDAGDFPIDYLIGNDQQMFSLLIKHLMNLGHRHFAFLINEPNYYEIKQRRELFREMLEMFDLPPGTLIECDTEPGQHSHEMAHLGLKRYLTGLQNKKMPFTALIVASAAGGLGALRAFHEMNIKVPEKCSIACCNGFESENALSIPSLTEAGIPSRFWGEALVKLLQQRFDGAETESLGIKLPAELTARESSGPAPEETALISFLKH